MNLEEIQAALGQSEVDGWLFFDHHRRDPLAYRILGIDSGTTPSRRWYYFIPVSGKPRKLVHRIESGALDAVPGGKQEYSSWTDQRDKLAALLSGARRVAMQYSPHCAVPYVSLVDAGTVELVRACGVEVVSSADLVQQFEARWTNEQFEMHVEAGKRVDRIRGEAFAFVRERLHANEPVTEYEAQQFIRERFSNADLITDHGPIVAANANASDPHYEPTREHAMHIQRGDLVLIDMWAKLGRPNAVYYDITWTGFCGDTIPERIQQVFDIVTGARRCASKFVIRKASARASLCGYQVDDAARGYIDERGYGKFFFHRTGHSIGTEVHGTGANMDNLESHDERRLIPGTCFSIEPGIYLPEFGVRSEVNVYMGDGFARVTGQEQTDLIRI
jgi:Xaa-Pro aminopeptidase